MAQSPATDPGPVPRRAARTPTGDPVLTARFAVPARPRPFVARPRLSDRLTAAVRGPLTLVSGPAGSGKTALLADWARRAPGRVVWLTAEAEDDTPGVFWAYVLEALRRQRVLGPDEVGHPAGAGEVSRSLLSRLAAALAELPEPVVLVLDDVDHVSAPEVTGGLQFVLAHAGGALRLVVAGRTEPLLPLHRYRAAGRLAEIRCADLAFTAAEAEELLRGHGLALSAAATAALITRTEGWAAGLRLCALAMERVDDPDAFLGDFEAGASPVADYLLAEALQVHPAATRDLLLRTSVLERTHPDLANALTGRDDAGWILESLRRANAFVEPIGGSWYRQHPLFAEILRAHLRTRHPGLEPRLHGRAARWFDAHGQAGDALAHAAAAGDWEFAAGRFVADLALGRLVTGLDADRLRALFAGMAPGTPGAAAALVEAGCRLAGGDAGGALAGLRQAGRQPGARRSEVRLGGALLRALAGGRLGAVGMAEAAARDAAELAGEVPADRLERHPELPALVLGALGSARLRAGDLAGAEEALLRAARTAREPGTEEIRQDALGRLAFADLLRGRLRRAVAHARESVAAADRAGLPPSRRSAFGHLALAGVAAERDRPAAARADLELAAAASGARHDPVAAGGLALVRARLCLAEDDWRGALALLRPLTGEAPRGAVPRWLAAEAAWTASAAHLAHGDTAAAVRAVAAVPRGTAVRTLAAARARLAAGDAVDLGALPPPDPAAGPAQAVRASLVRAQAAVARGAEGAARRLVDHALALARPEALRRPFLEAGPWLRALLSAGPDPGAAGDWLTPSVSDGPAARDAGPPQPPAEPLSAREREVLQRAAQFLSTEEIADELCVSVNTVKTHLKSIYRKLSAGRRGEAVRRARQLRLL